MADTTDIGDFEITGATKWRWIPIIEICVYHLYLQKCPTNQTTKPDFPMDYNDYRFTKVIEEGTEVTHSISGISP